MIREVLTDEKGSLSAARTFLLGSLVFTGALIVLDSTVWEVPGTAYTLLGSLVVGLVAWAGGPRVAQYVAPQIGAVASGIAKSIKEPVRPNLLDSSPEFRENDEK
jgi:hypothetical protein|tara:strand:- start:5713 stop:6027 length:315 start_codon:yes stop_codon:yes gene_type:complete